MARNDGANPSLVRVTNGWDLYVGGVKILNIDGSGTLTIKGDIHTNENP